VDQELAQQDPLPPTADVSAAAAVSGEPAPPELENKSGGEEESYQPERGALAEWTFTILLLLFGTTMLVQAYVIPTGSMESTLLIGDHLLVDKLAYAPPGKLSRYLLPYRPIKRGDIIVFRYPLDLTNTFVKRAIGLPGDRIRIADKVLYINGKAMNEPYVIHKFGHIDNYKDYFPSDTGFGIRKEAHDMLEQHVDKKTGELVVPDECYFAMGDNRDESDDSRFWGFVPRQNIIGKPLVVYWSFDASTEHLQDPSVSLEHLADLSVHFFSKTRWKRSFLIVRGYPLE
jgi:signal peptidase I